MKNRVVFYLILSSFYLSISGMELATTSDDQTSPLNDLYAHRTLDWINPEKQTSIIRNLLTLQKSNFSHSDVSKRITYQLFILHTQDEYEELAHICQYLRLGRQKFDIKDIAPMPYSDRKKLILMYNKSMGIECLVNGLSIQMISESDYKEAIEILPADTRDKLEVQIVPNNCFCNYMPKIAGSLVFLTGVGYTIYGIVTSNAAVAPVCISLMVSGPVITLISQHMINEKRSMNSQEYNKLLP